MLTRGRCTGCMLHHSCPRRTPQQSTSPQFLTRSDDSQSAAIVAKDRQCFRSVLERLCASQPCNHFAAPWNIAPLEGSSDYPATLNRIRSGQEVRVEDFVGMFAPAEMAAGDIEQQACTLLDP